MRQLLAASGRSTWTSAFAFLAFFVVGALIRSASSGSVALPVVGGLVAAALVAVIAWQLESRKKSTVL